MLLSRAFMSKPKDYLTHFPLIENHFQQGIVGYEVDKEGIFGLRYLQVARKQKGQEKRGQVLPGNVP